MVEFKGFINKTVNFGTSLNRRPDAVNGPDTRRAISIDQVQTTAILLISYNEYVTARTKRRDTRLKHIFATRRFGAGQRRALG